MLDRTALPPPPPRRTPPGRPRPGTASRSTDDYAWLRADNWREVMRDPSVLDPAIRAYLEAENAYAKAALAHTEPLQADAVRRDEGPHQGGRLLGAEPGRPVRLLLRAIAKAGSIRSSAAQPRDGGASEILLDGDALAAGKAYFQLGGDAPFARPSAARLVGRRQGIGVRHAARPRPRDRRATSPTSFRTSTGSPVWTADSIRLLLRAARRQSPSLARLSPSARHAGGRRRAGLRGEGRAAIFVSLGQTAVRPLRRDLGARPRDLGMLAARPRRSRRDAVAGRGARNVGAVRRRASSGTGRRRDAGDPHQCGRRGRLQDRARAARHARPRELARSRAAPARHLHPARIIVLADWLVRLEREDGLPRIVVRQLASGEEHTIAFRRGGLFARRGRRLRVRDRPAALPLFVDDDAERGLGLRPDDARRARCASARRSRAGTIRPPT